MNLFSNLLKLILPHNTLKTNLSEEDLIEDPESASQEIPVFVEKDEWEY